MIFYVFDRNNCGQQLCNRIRTPVCSAVTSTSSRRWREEMYFLPTYAALGGSIADGAVGLAPIKHTSTCDLKRRRTG